MKRAGWQIGAVSALMVVLVLAARHSAGGTDRVPEPTPRSTLQEASRGTARTTDTGWLTQAQSSVTTTTAPPQTTTTTVPVPATQQQTQSTGDVVALALAQVGKAYRTGAAGPNAFDCSGLVYWVFNHAGIHIPRMTAQGYFGAYPHVSQPVPGDVVYYRDHIAIYVGSGEIVAASTPRGGVKHYSMNAPGRITGFAQIN